MKKVLYSLLILFSLFAGFTKVDALMMTFDELETQGKITINDEEVVDNIYVVGDYIFTNYITEADVASAGKTVSDIIRYNTETDEWSYVNETKTLDLEEQLVVRYDKDNNEITLDYIHDEEELRYALSEKNNATELVLLNDITGVKERLIINKSLTFDGNGNTISFTSDVNSSTHGTRHGFLVNANNVTVMNLNVLMDALDEKWTGTYGIQAYNSNGVVFENVTATGADAGLFANNSDVTLKGTIDLSSNEFGGMEVSNGVAALTVDAEILNNSEEYAKPTIWIDEVNTNSANVQISGTDNMFINTIAKVGQHQYYLDELNAYKFKIETSFDKALVVDGEKNSFVTGGSLTVYSDEEVENVTVEVDLTSITKPDGATFDLTIEDYEKDTEVNVLDNNVLYSGSLTNDYSEYIYLNALVDTEGDYSFKVLIKENDTVRYEKTINITAKNTIIEATSIYYLETSEVSSECPQSEYSNGIVVIGSVLDEETVTINVNVKSKPENSNVEIWSQNGKLDGQELTVETFLVKDIIIEADTPGEYSIDVEMKDQKDTLIDTSNLEFVVVEELEEGL